MWGETGEINLAASAISVPEVTMLHAVAKIYIGLNFPTSGTEAQQNVAAGLSNFRLEEFYLYNTSNKLQVAPSTGNLNNSDPSNPVVTATTIPDGTGVFASGSVDPIEPILYLPRAYNPAPARQRSFMSEIYLAEHLKGSDGDRSNNPCIVIGARYGNSTAAITYYRIDLVKTTVNSDGVVTAQEYLPVLRNHRYKINITSVHGRGYDTPLDAFKAMGINTNLKVVITSDARVTNVVYDGQYMLGVDLATVEVDKRAITTGKKIYVNTDYPGGWKAAVTNGSSWLTLSTASGGNGGSSLIFNVAAYTGTVNRPGTITIQAGRLFMDITVVQSYAADIEFANVASAML
jgi:hypothetical protein